MPEYTAPGAIRREPGEKFASFAARQRASQLPAFLKLKKRQPRKLAEQHAADTIDGYDRDDTGESL